VRRASIVVATAFCACSKTQAGTSAAAPPAPPPSPPAVCNGHAELCGRTYDQVAFPGTHDAYSNVTDGFQAPDQTNTMTRQLEDGVRVLHLEIVAYQGSAYLCHSLCFLGKKLLVDGLAEVHAFLGAHPDEVVTLLMESSNVTSDVVATAVVESGLATSVHAETAGAPWPTLGEMIQRGDRVVAFLADQTGTGGGSYSWLLPRWTLTWETPWDNTTPQDFGRCNADRGTMGAPIYVVDTYLEDQVIPTAAHAALVNHNPFLIDRLLSCRMKTGALPNFVMVNYYEVGDVFPDVDILNGFAPAPNDNLGAFPPTSWPDAGMPDAGDAGGTD
jgi:hypothetical protein